MTTTPAAISETEPAIEVRGLTKIYGGKKVVDAVDMSVPKGAIYGFIGPNGSGKTTTIRMMCALLTPDGGEGHTLGYDIRKDARLIKENVGYMTQKFSLYGDLTIRENLDFMARMYRVKNRKKVVDETLRTLGLEGRGKQLAGTLSGGWKQRLALAACMQHKPALLLLDEPTAGVDPKARRDFWDEIRQLSKQGVTVLVSTHYMDEAVQCDYIAYIAYGKKLIDGPAAEIPHQVGLTTWRVSGRDLIQLEDDLRADPRVEQVARFGAQLHVSSTDSAGLDAVVAEKRNENDARKWEKKEAELEEVFIYLMATAADNFGVNGGPSA